MRLSKVFTKLKKGGDGVDISPDSNKTSQLLSFLNIISANMRLLIVPLQKKDAFPLTSELIKELQYSDMYKGINTMFGGYKELLIEMLQGLQFQNDSIFSLEDPNCRANSSFYCLCCDLGKFNSVEIKMPGRQNKIDLSSIFDPITETIKLDFLEIIDNILKQSFSKRTFSFVFKFLTNPKRHFYIGEYIKYIYIKYIDQIEPGNPKFEERFNSITCGDIELKRLVRTFKKDPTIYQDNYLKMACLLHYILMSLCDKLHIKEAIKYFEMSKQEFSSVERTIPRPQVAKKKDEKKDNKYISIKDTKSSTEDVKDLDKTLSMGSRKGSRATKSMEKKRITSFDQKQAEIQTKTENQKKIDENNKRE